jgi:hypothetical protein
LTLRMNESTDQPTKQSANLLSITVILTCLSFTVLPNQWIDWSSHWLIVILTALLTSIGIWLIHINHIDQSNEVDIWETVWLPMKQAIDAEEQAYQSAKVINQSINQPNPIIRPPSPKRPVGRPRVI